MAAVNAAARVEFTSPTTTTRSGRSLASTGSSATITSAIWRIGEPCVGAQVVVGLRQAEILEEDVAHGTVVVLTGVDRTCSKRT